MIEWEVTVPVYDNNGDHLYSEVEEVKERVMAVVGGYTTARVSGVWRDADGQEYSDESFLLRFTWSGAAYAIERLLPELCALLRQKQLYVVQRECTVHMIAPKTPEGEAPVYEW